MSSSPATRATSPRTIEQMGDRAIADFKRKQPEISAEALNVLANHYTFAFK